MKRKTKAFWIGFLVPVVMLWAWMFVRWGGGGWWFALFWTSPAIAAGGLVGLVAYLCTSGAPMSRRWKPLLKTRRPWHWGIVLMCVGMWAVALGYGMSVLLPPPTQISRGWPQSFILMPIVLVGGIIVLAVMGGTFLKWYGLLVAGIGVLSPFMYALIFEPYPGNNMVGMFFAVCSAWPGILLIIAGIVIAMVSAVTGRFKFEPLKCVGCGYSLVGLTGDKCPECGRTVSSTSPS